MPPENDKNHNERQNKAEAHLNDQLLNGVQAKWKSELARLLPDSKPSESPLTYRQEISKSVHDYMHSDRDFADLNKRLHKDHALGTNFKVIGVAVHEGLPELIVIDKDKHHKHPGVSALAVSAENGRVTGTFSKDANGGLFHSNFIARQEDQFPMPDRSGAIIWREGHGQGRIREIDTPGGVKEILNYDPLGRVHKLDIMIGTRALSTYQRNEDGSYDVIQPLQRVVRGQVDSVNIIDDNSTNAGKITFSMFDGRVTKDMRPSGEVRRFYRTSI